jgi:hypothetical protein
MKRPLVILSSVGLVAVLVFLLTVRADEPKPDLTGGRFEYVYADGEVVIDTSTGQVWCWHPLKKEWRDLEVPVKVAKGRASPAGRYRLSAVREIDGQPKESYALSVIDSATGAVWVSRNFYGEAGKLNGDWNSRPPVRESK